MRFKLRASYLIVFAGICGFGTAEASSLQWYYNNASGLGNAYSGEAAIADDASTEYFNPAGLTRFDHQQLVGGLVGSRYSNQFNGTTVNTPNPAGLNVGPNLTQKGGAFSQALVPWPFFYYNLPLPRNLALGFGVSSPFGIGADFSSGSMVRYNGTRFCFVDIDFSVSLAYKINEAFSSGLGVDINRLSITDNLAIQNSFNQPDSHSLNSAVDWGHGWHAGLLYQFNAASRVGLAYHSKVVMHPHGKSEFVVIPGSNVGNEIISNNFKFTYYLPPSFALSGYHEINPQWAVLGTVDYTQWSAQQNINLQNFAINVGPTTAPVPLEVNNTIVNGYRNTLRLALGANYKWKPEWLLRTGIAFEQDPSNPTYRTANDPGSGSTSLAVGAHYQMHRNLGIDMGYQHFFMRSVSINTVNSLGTDSQNGTGQLSQDSVGVQATWDFV